MKYLTKRIVSAAGLSLNAHVCCLGPSGANRMQTAATGIMILANITTTTDIRPISIQTESVHMIMMTKPVGIPVQVVHRQQTLFRKIQLPTK